MNVMNRFWRWRLVPVLAVLFMPCFLSDARCEEKKKNSSSTPEKRMRTLFERYDRQKLSLDDVFQRLETWDRSDVLTASKAVLKSDAGTLSTALDPERLRDTVRPSLKKQIRKKRRRLLRIIRNKRRYKTQNRDLKRKVTRASLGLLTLFRKPLVYHMQTSEKYSSSFFRAVALLRFLRSSEVSISGATKDLLEQIANAREIVSTDTVGRARDMQPEAGKNRDVVRSNETADVNLSKKERTLVRTVNLYREVFGLRKLMIHARVTEAAREQSRHMKEIGKLTHTSDEASRTPLLDRLEDHGFSAKKAGENVAEGEHSARAILKGWIQSPSHHRNLLTENYRYLGVAKEGRFWTLDMATVPRIRSRGGTSR